MPSVLLLGGHPQGDAAVERHGVDLEVESLAVLVGPGGADAGPEAFVAQVLTVTHLVGDVGGFARFGFGRHVGIPFT